MGHTYIQYVLRPLARVHAERLRATMLPIFCYCEYDTYNTIQFVHRGPGEARDASHGARRAHAGPSTGAGAGADPVVHVSFYTSYSSRDGDKYYRYNKWD